MRRSTQSQGSDGERSHHRWCWKKRRCGPVKAMTSMAQDLHDERQKAHPSFSLESCLLAPFRSLPACRDAAPPSISPCLIFCRAASGHSQARSSAVTCPCVVVSAHTICRSSAPPATASQDTYRAVAIALSKNRQTACSSRLIDTAPLGCPRPCILPSLPKCSDLSGWRLCLCRHHTFSADPLCRACCETRSCWHKHYALLALGCSPLRHGSCLIVISLSSGPVHKSMPM